MIHYISKNHELYLEANPEQDKDYLELARVIQQYAVLLFKVFHPFSLI
jgi:hypothetical protein